MGRPSKLTDRQWISIEKRFLAGESAANLAKEFKVDRTVISRRFSHATKTVKSVANQLVASDAALKSLTVSQQISARTLADELIAISMHLAGAGKFGAATAHRLSGIAHAKVQEIDDAAPLDAASVESLRGVAVLTKMANDSAVIGLNLLAANKDALRGLDAPTGPISKIIVEVVNAKPAADDDRAASRVLPTH